MEPPRPQTEPLRPAAKTRRHVGLLAFAMGLLFSTLGLARYGTFHNETFDLAFYTRIAWGLSRFEFWEPMVNAHVYGLDTYLLLDSKHQINAQYLRSRTRYPGQVSTDFSQPFGACRRYSANGA